MIASTMEAKQHQRHGPFAIWCCVTIVTLIRVGYLFANDRPLDVEEAQYWSWSTHLQWGYHSKGPLIAWVIRLSTLLNGPSPVGIRFFVPFMYAVSSFMFYYTAHRLHGHRIAFYAAAMLVLSPNLFWNATHEWVISQHVAGHNVHL